MKLPVHISMRALIVLGVLLAVIAGVTVARNQEAGPRAAFTTMQSRAIGGLDAHWNERTGVPDFVAGKDPTVFLPYTPSAAERGNPAAIARGFLDENRALFKLTSATDQLALLRVESDMQLGFAHVRLNQTYHNIPVFGKQLVVHLDAQENVIAVNGQFAPEIIAETRPSQTQDDAENVALQDLLLDQLEADERATVVPEILKDKTRLMVYVDEYR